MSVRLLTCAPLTSNLPNKMKNKSHLLDLSDDIDKSSLPDKLILVCPIFLICSLTWTIKEERKQSYGHYHCLVHYHFRKIHQQNA